MSTGQARRLPEKPTLKGLEARWRAHWGETGVYAFDRSRTRAEVYAIDTPPPTVSGSLHVGHVFSFTHADVIARYQRMRGREVFYPMGWDDNGLPTERRVQNYYNVRCDPSVPYDPSWDPSQHDGKRLLAISRPNFVELCHRLTAEDEKAFEELFRTLGLSVDWSFLYATIDDRSRRVAQRGFLRNLARGEAYQALAPTMWDVDFHTAVAQAEIEDREVGGAYHRILFDDIEIETSRPELIPSCCALVAHPDDERYKPRFGTAVHTPLFGVEVPVLAHPLAIPDKGTGIAMVCTFGDVTDIVWWRELQLPARALVQRDGRFPVDHPQWITSERGRHAWESIAGRRLDEVRAIVIDAMRVSGEMLGEPRPITHPVKFFEKGRRPLEIVSSRQWYIRNGGTDMALRSALLERGQELRWHPAYMQTRYEHWVSGLNSDWLISRQRFFGVPVPLWYRVGADGSVLYDEVLTPDESDLPIDPSTDVPHGFSESQRDQPGGFTGDPDVMDTWATSSLSPHIAAGWEEDPDLFARVFPMDLRPQAHEIIRTWLFGSVVRAHLEHGTLPWSDALISGWVLDPERKKMSKSKGNATTPVDLLEQYGSDAVRYWAASARPGVDTAFEEAQIRIGQRLAIKLLNASRFALSLPAPSGDARIARRVDADMLARLSLIVAEATAALDAYDHGRAVSVVEPFFWWFCDDYLELVKARVYGTGDGAESGRLALTTALSVMLRLLAPAMPFVTEEIWSWWQSGSIHRAPWPLQSELSLGESSGGRVLDTAVAVLGEIRKAKSAAKLSVKAPVERVVVRDTEENLALLREAAEDVCAAGTVDEIAYETADAFAVDITLREAGVA